MDTIFNIWKTNRTHYFDLFNDFSVQQLNKVPEDFNNNIVWNIGHVIAIQQVLIYKRCGLDMNISDDFYQLYKSGSKPERLITASEIDELKSLLESTIISTQEDYKKGIFKTYDGLTTSTRFEINSIDTAFQFNNYHEGLHLGAINGLKNKVR